MFLNNIRQQRQARGLSQTKLAGMVGMAESTLSDLELGKRRPWPKARADLAKALGVSEEELFPVEKVKTSLELGFGEPKVGYEWDAGLTPPKDNNPGRWTIRRDEDRWVVLFRSFLALGTSGPDYIITTFSPTEDGERAAKSMALKLVDIAWGRN